MFACAIRSFNLRGHFDAQSSGKDPHTPLKVNWDPESQEPNMVGNGRAQIYVVLCPIQCSRTSVGDWVKGC